MALLNTLTITIHDDDTGEDITVTAAQITTAIRLALTRHELEVVVYLVGLLAQIDPQGAALFIAALDYTNRPGVAQG